MPTESEIIRGMKESEQLPQRPPLSGGPYPDNVVKLFQQGSDRGVNGATQLFDPPAITLDQLYSSRDKAQLDSLLVGDNEKYEEFADTYSMGGTVEDLLIKEMENQYNEDFLDQHVFDEDFMNSPEDEKIRIITGQWDRLDSQKQTKRNLVALNLLRQGLGGVPETALDQVVLDLTPSQTVAMYEQYQQQQMAQLQRDIDHLAAREGEGFDTSVAVAEIVEQDVAPFWGAITRVAATREFLPDGLEVGTLRALLPGELRQEIREWWVGASQEERQEWLQDLNERFEEVRSGPNRGIYTRYVVVENLMGIFTPELLEAGDPTQTLDRVFGNLDVALGALIAGGLIAKRGKSIFSLWSTPKHSTSRQMAAAGGRRPVQSELDKSIEKMAQEAGFTSSDTAVKDIVKPSVMEETIEVDVDNVKHTITPNEARMQRIMANTDDADITFLNKDDKLNVVKKELDELSNNDTMHPMHKMSTFKVLPNDTGVEFNITFGQAPDQAWNDLGVLLKDLEELDPEIIGDYKIVRRGMEGTLEDLGLSRLEIIDYLRRGRVSRNMEEMLDLEDSFTEISRLFGGRRLSKISSEELQGALDINWVPKTSPAYDMIKKELRMREAGTTGFLGQRDALSLVDGDELFIQTKHTRFYMPDDKTNLGDAFRYWNVPFVHSAQRFLGRLFPPNAKFDNLYKATRRGYHMEESTHQEFNDILRPFSTLNAKEQQEVHHIIEWVEDYALDMYEETGMMKAPDTSLILSENPSLSERAMEGYLAMREALDGLYDVFNRRLYKDMNNRGHVTIRPRKEGLPNYHGAQMKAPKPGKYYNPITRNMESYDAEDLEALMLDGGGAMKLDFPISSPSGGQFDQIIVKRGDYEFGKLSDRVLNYYEGYHFRFHEDPYYIIKREYGATVNGVKLPDNEFVETAIRTAGSYNEGVRWINRGKGTWIDNGKGTFTNLNARTSHTQFEIKGTKSLSNTEGSLYQQQALQREGRLFWDERSRSRLPDTNGNRAIIADPARAVQKGMAVALRQTTQEGLFKSVKEGFKAEYGDLPLFSKFPSKLNTDDLQTLERELVHDRMNYHANTKARYDEAIEIIRYMRSQLGTNAFLIPHLRHWMVEAAKWLDRGDSTSKIRKGTANLLTRYGMGANPFSTMRRAAYNALMVLRPVRQAFLQSSQVTMLTGLAPKYIMSGQIFSDSMALRIGVARLRRAGFDDGWSDSKLAKAMGLSKKEYKRLVEEFNRSGLLGSVNTHAYNPSAAIAKGLKDMNAGPVGRFTYDAKAVGAKAHSKFAQYGFEWGEQNNLTFSYLVGLKRMKKKLGVDDITKFTKEQWDEVVDEADGLALGMTRPNKFGYQTGLAGVTFQFMSFQHRALITFLGMNPRLTAQDTAKILAGTYLLWGTNMLGAEDWARDLLTQMGLTNNANDEIMPGVTLQDLLAAGLIETFFNGIGRASSDDWSDLNIGILAPGAAVAEMYKMMYEIVAERPISTAWVGPFGSILDGFLQGVRFIQGDAHNDTRTPAEKIARGATVLGRYTLPWLNDANRSWIAYQSGVWLTKGNDSLEMKPTYNNIIARLGLGIRSEEEMAWYKMKSKHWEDGKNIKNWVETWRPVIKEMVTMWGEDIYGPEQAIELVSTISSLTEDAPEGIREEIYRQLMTVPDDTGDTIVGLVAERMSKGMKMSDFIPYINQVQSIPPESKQDLIDLMIELDSVNLEGEQLFFDTIKEDLEDNR